MIKFYSGLLQYDFTKVLLIVRSIFHPSNFLVRFWITVWIIREFSQKPLLVLIIHVSDSHPWQRWHLFYSVIITCNNILQTNQGTRFKHLLVK